MAKQFEIEHRKAWKDTDIAFEDTATEVQIVRRTDNEGKKAKEVFAAFDKERIPDLVKWLNSLGRQKKLEV